MLHQTMLQGQAQYGANNNDEYAGINTSGLEFQIRAFVRPNRIGVRAGQLVDFGDQLLGDTTPSTPASTWDWISPTLGDQLGFSVNRAKRHANIFNGFACPSAEREIDGLFGFAPDRAAFDALQQSQGYLQVSFLSPAAFHFYPSDFPRPMIDRLPGFRVLSPALTLSGPRTVPEQFDYRLPSDQRPRFSSIQHPADKILTNDGCRYLTDNDFLDFDLDHTPNLYGSFVDPGPSSNFSRAFRRLEDPKGARHWRLSIRHKGNTLKNTGRFDGSVVTIGVEEAYTNPFPWYPTGSTLFDPTPEATEAFADDKGVIVIDR